ncbi:ABC transporter substrate-binding protein [Actinosynnema sp. ALI-1.44]|uniref:substrate-binding domain-containing protein n=1 Tax=Actinosynnema sp. ALI-1.44 TaxID=1933779 RepID=UPI00097BF82E|nr:substrate-binding domain-containing protein [Actinosynnema sp. ALI-1.44]ONI86410.1 ABC transporter substrate-binding protein [Actinosynnema sp. ALI-1.44]
MKRLLAAGFALLVLAGCSTDLPDAAPPGSSGAPATSEFFDQAEYDRQLALRDAKPVGPADKPWEQALNPEMADTARFAKPGPYEICFANASVDNPWRQVGWKTMQVEATLHPEIGKFTVLDAEAKDDKQISDIQQLTSGGCSALIVSPNTTATLTPAVEAACAKGIPVIVFDRGVNTKCPVTFIHPIGGYAFGATAAEFLAGKVGQGGKVLALRVLPGVDVLEHRWAAGQRILAAKGVTVAGVEFTGNDGAKAKSIVSDYLQRGDINGIWMDDGTAAVPVLEAFEDAGKPLPAISGEDQQQFLDKWRGEKLTAQAPTYPTYQWRTPVIAAVKVLKGEQVPKEWILPQPVITDTTLDSYRGQGMPPLHYALCGCQQMPGYPGKWK